MPLLTLQACEPLPCPNLPRAIGGSRQITYRRSFRLSGLPFDISQGRGQAWSQVCDPSYR